MTADKNTNEPEYNNQSRLLSGIFFFIAITVVASLITFFGYVPKKKGSYREPAVFEHREVEVPRPKTKAHFYDDEPIEWTEDSSKSSAIA